MIFKGSVARLMATPAVWVSSATGVSLEVKVYFNSPDQVANFDKTDFIDTETCMEYYKGDFPGLAYLVDNGSQGEIVTVDGVDYLVSSVKRLHDGNTYKAYLQAVGSDVED